MQIKVNEAIVEETRKAYKERKREEAERARKESLKNEFKKRRKSIKRKNKKFLPFSHKIGPRVKQLKLKIKKGYNSTLDNLKMK